MAQRINAYQQRDLEMQRLNQSLDNVHRLHRRAEVENTRLRAERDAILLELRNASDIIDRVMNAISNAPAQEQNQ